MCVLLTHSLEGGVLVECQTTEIAVGVRQTWAKLRQTCIVQLVVFCRVTGMDEKRGRENEGGTFKQREIKYTGMEREKDVERMSHRQR